MKTEGFDEEIKELEEAGMIKRKKTRDGEKLEFTEQGLKATEFKIGLDTDMQLFLFTVMWNEMPDYENPHLKLVKIGERLKENPGINIFRTLEANPEKVEGIELKKDLPEEFVMQFDP